MSMDPKDDPVWEDVEIKIRWGTLRGLRRRSKDTAEPPVRMLGLHGWLDNCKAFDPLVKHLSKHIDFLVLDLPGHGLSDHIPQGAKYDNLTYSFSLKDAMLNYGWDTFIVVGHSLGSSIGHFLTALFPRMVESFISIDYLGYKGTPTRVVSFELFKTEVEKFDHLENLKRKPPEYCEQEMVDKLVESRVFTANLEPSLTYPFAKILFDRGVRQLESGLYTWTHDQRVKATFLFSPGYRFTYAMALSYTCPLLLIIARNGIYSSTSLDEKRVVAAYSKNCSHFTYVKVSGRHHLHMTNARAVAFQINKFIQSISEKNIVAKL